MNPIKSPYDLLLERAGLQYGNPTTQVKGPQDMMAEMIAAGHPIQKFKDGKKVSNQYGGYSMSDYIHGYQADPTGRFGGKDRMATVPHKFDRNLLDATMRAIQDAESLGGPKLSNEQILNLLLHEGREDLGSNVRGFNSKNPRAKALFENLTQRGHDFIDAIIPAQILEKQETAKRLGIPFELAWNGTGKVHGMNRTGQDYVNEANAMSYAATHPKNAELLDYITRTRTANLTPQEKIASNIADLERKRATTGFLNRDDLKAYLLDNVSSDNAKNALKDLDSGLLHLAVQNEYRKANNIEPLNLNDRIRVDQYWKDNKRQNVPDLATNVSVATGIPEIDKLIQGIVSKSQQGQRIERPQTLPQKMLGSVGLPLNYDPVQQVLGAVGVSDKNLENIKNTFNSGLGALQNFIPPVQGFKEGSKVSAKMAPGATLPDTTHTPLLQQGKDRLNQMGQNILEAHARQQALQNQAFEPGSVTKVRDPKALSEMANDMLAGPLGFMPAGIIKEKGGQWLNRSVDKNLDRFKFNNIEQQLNAPTKAEIEQMTPQMQEVWNNVYKNADLNNAVNKWVNSNLSNYVKNQMGTMEDPVRKLADEGISHLPLHHGNISQFEPWTSVGKNLYEKRVSAGFPGNTVSETPLGRQWENLTDSTIRSDSVQNMLTHGEGTWSPWLRKIEDRNTPVNQVTGTIHSLGFDHILDVLKQDLESGIIRPEQLSKVSMADAVRRAHLFDQEMAKKMAQARLQAQTEMPVHKDYGESGYKWYELTTPKITELPTGWKLKHAPDTSGAMAYEARDPTGKLISDAPTIEELFNTPAIKALNKEKLEQALKYEGDTMGHCVGGYCPDVLSGRTKIYSLRDAKGEPHVTIEVEPQGFNLRFSDLVKTLGEDKANEMITAPGWHDLTSRKQLIRDYFKDAGVDLPQEAQKIIQIKGKQNAAPKEDYIPYVQDFVRSGDWQHVGDFSNTGLIDPQSALAATHLNMNNATDKLGGRKYLTQDEFQTLMKGGDLPPLNP